MNMSIYVKSGTGGYSDDDGCDLLVKKIEDPNFPIPRIGESIDILEKTDSLDWKDANGDPFKEYHQYLVTNVRYWIGNDSFGVDIYVVPIGRSLFH